MGFPGDIHLQVLAWRYEDVVVVPLVPLVAQPARAHASSVVGIAIGVNLGAVVEPRIPAWIGVDVVRRVHAGAAVIVWGTRLVVRRNHRDV